VTEPAERAEHGLPLRIGDLWLQDDVDDHLWHGDEGTGISQEPGAAQAGAVRCARQDPLGQACRPALTRTGGGVRGEDGATPEPCR
jgi:hypothetical protein